MKGTRPLLALAFALLAASLCTGAEKAVWEAFELKSEEVDGVTVYYEESLADTMPDVREILKGFLAEQARTQQSLSHLLAKSKEVLEDVNRIVGAKPDGEALKKQQEVLSFIVRKTAPAFNLAEAKVPVVKRGTIKDYLRKGGSLRGFTYDKATDTAVFKSGSRIRQGDPGEAPALDLLVPVNGPEDVKGAAEAVFGALRQMTRDIAGLALHEVVEFVIVNERLRPRDPYFRWFSDGFANAIAIRLLKKHVGESEATSFAGLQDPKRYTDLERNLNLYYWMGADWRIESPLESEERLEKARYAYATLEAQRLIEEHGIQCVAAILDKVATYEKKDSRNLVAATREVTGEDVEKRFRRYQNFDTAAEGVRQYADQFNQAMARKDYAAALSNLIRIQELRGPWDDLRMYGNAAYLLFRMGHEAAGDRVMHKQLALLKRHGLEKPHLGMQKLFVQYALRSRNFKKAYETAEEILKVDGDFVLALTVRMDRLATSGKIAEAKQVARRILELEKDTTSAAYKLAERLLAIEPENP